MYCSLHPYDRELLEIEYNIISRQAEQEIGWAQFLKARHIAEHKREWEERLQDYIFPRKLFRRCWAGSSVPPATVLPWLNTGWHGSMATKTIPMGSMTSRRLSVGCVQPKNSPRHNMPWHAVIYRANVSIPISSGRADCRKELQRPIIRMRS